MLNGFITIVVYFGLLIKYKIFPLNKMLDILYKMNQKNVLHNIQQTQGLEYPKQMINKDDNIHK